MNAGTFGTTYVLDAKNGLSLLRTNKAPASAWAKVAAAQRRIANGSIKVVSTATEAAVKRQLQGVQHIGRGGLDLAAPPTTSR